MTVPMISPRQLYDIRQSGGNPELIDVRTPVEFRALHAEGARLVPLDQLDPKAVMAARDDGAVNQPLYVICRSGSRARQACERFHAAGFQEVICVDGGTLAWEQAGLPVVRGKKAISLDRQVRIAIGLLVILGVTLGFLVHEWFHLLAAAVGAGVLYAGITDTCFMAMLLARMPWNQVRPSESTCTPVGAEART